MVVFSGYFVEECVTGTKLSSWAAVKIWGEPQSDNSIPVTVIETSELTRLREFEARAKLLERGEKQARDRD